MAEGGHLIKTFWSSTHSSVLRLAINRVSSQAPVASGVQYIFNVAMRDANNITSTYRASNMTFSFTSYQQCVSDPGCESQVRPVNDSHNAYFPDKTVSSA